MMDFGFGAFLEKFEDHFGRFATKLILILIGLAIVSVTGSIIWATLLKPLVGLIPQTDSNSWNWDRITGTAWTALLIGGGVGVGLEGIAVIHNARAAKRLSVGVRETKAVLAEAEALREEIRKTMQEARDMVSTGDLTIDEMLVTAERKGMITPETAALVRSLRDAGSEIPASSDRT